MNATLEELGKHDSCVEQSQPIGVDREFLPLGSSSQSSGCQTDPPPPIFQTLHHQYTAVDATIL